MIWLDLDGVMADFDGHYEHHFGVRPTRWPGPDSVDWKLVNSVPDFFLTMPCMPGARDLFLVAFLASNGDVGFLTGCPASIDAAANQKRQWIAQEPGFGNSKVVCCRSRDKCLHGKPGDILIDDYLKYADLWTGMGGIFIHYTSAKDSILQLKRMFNP